MPESFLPSLHTFKPLAGAEFTVRAQAGEAVPVRLAEVQSLGFNTPAERGGRESFSLIFHAPTRWPWEQGNYVFSHPAMGELAIFVVPLGPVRDGMQLQAIFNFS